MIPLQLIACDAFGCACPTLVSQDNCAMWLNGFNDNIDGYPKVQCEMVPCPAPYMGPQRGAPPDTSKGKQGPFGTGSSTPEFGMCPIDKPFENEEEVHVACRACSCS